MQLHTPPPSPPSVTNILRLCLQDFYKFCVFAFVLQVCIFMLSVSRLSQHAHPGQEIFKRTMSVLIAAIPTGAPTGKDFCSSDLICLMSWGATGTQQTKKQLSEF